jgi:hypothetical protein
MFNTGQLRPVIPTGITLLAYHDIISYVHGETFPFWPTYSLYLQKLQPHVLWCHYLNWGIGPNATEDQFHGIYNGILTHWFPTSCGYIIDHQVYAPGGKPGYIIVCHARGFHNPILIVEIKCPSKWTVAGQQMVMDELADYIEGWFDLTQYNTIYSLGGIGLNCMVCEMHKSGDSPPLC